MTRNSKLRIQIVFTGLFQTKARCTIFNIPIIRFSSGIISPKADARDDVDFYSGGCRHLDNMIPRKYGSVVRRPGTKHIYTSTRPLVEDK